MCSCRRLRRLIAGKLELLLGPAASGRAPSGAQAKPTELAPHSDVEGTIQTFPGIADSRLRERVRREAARRPARKHVMQ